MAAKNSMCDVCTWGLTSQTLPGGVTLMTGLTTISFQQRDCGCTRHMALTDSMRVHYLFHNSQGLLLSSFMNPIRQRGSKTGPMQNFMSRILAPPPNSAGDPLLPLFQGDGSKHGDALVLLPVRVSLCRRRAAQTHPRRRRQPQRPQPGTRLPRLCAPEDVPWCEAPPWTRAADGYHGAGIDCLFLPA